MSSWWPPRNCSNETTYSPDVGDPSLVRKIEHWNPSFHPQSLHILIKDFVSCLHYQQSKSCLLPSTLYFAVLFKSKIQNINIIEYNSIQLEMLSSSKMQLNVFQVFQDILHFHITRTSWEVLPKYITLILFSTYRYMTICT